MLKKELPQCLLSSSKKLLSSGLLVEHRRGAEGIAQLSSHQFRQRGYIETQHEYRQRGSAAAKDV